jgi:hypothetical protein
MAHAKWSSSELTVAEDQVVALELERQAAKALHDEYDEAAVAAAKKLRAEHAKLEEEAAAGREAQRKADVVDSIRSSEEKRFNAFVNRGIDLPPAPDIHKGFWAKVGGTNKVQDDNAQIKHDQNLRSRANMRGRSIIGVEVHQRDLGQMVGNMLSLESFGPSRDKTNEMLFRPLRHKEGGGVEVGRGRGCKGGQLNIKASSVSANDLPEEISVDGNTRGSELVIYLKAEADTCEGMQCETNQLYPHANIKVPLLPADFLLLL